MAWTLGVATYKYLWAFPLAEALARIAATGIRQVELMTVPPHVWIGEMDEAVCARLRRLFADLGLTPCALNPTALDLGIASTNPGIRQETVRQLVATAEAAGRLDVPLVVLSAGRVHPLIAPPFDHSLGLLKESLAPILAACERAGVTIGFENGWNLIDRAAQLKRLVEEVGHPCLKIAYDVANANVVEDAVAGLELVKEHLVHLHLSDSRPQVRAHAPIGQGNVDYGAVARVLKGSRFQGISVLEIIDAAASDQGIRESVAALESRGWTL
jgi:sugar phosphate isomerase/epimerase